MKAICVFLTVVMFSFLLNSCAVFKKSINGIYFVEIIKGSEVDFGVKNILPVKAAKFVEYYQSGIAVVWYDTDGNETENGYLNGTYLGYGYILTSFNLKTQLTDNYGRELSKRFFFKNQEAKIIDGGGNAGPIVLLRILTPSDSIKWDDHSVSQFLNKKLKQPKIKLEFNCKIFEKAYFVDAVEEFFPTYFVREGKIMAVTQSAGFFILDKTIGPRNFGSLVFNKNGNCIGIVGGSMSDTSEAIVIPAVYVKIFLGDRFKEVFE